MFIKSVKMSNYRTIKDTEVDFLPGLNIIIGDNGSGKTNFLKMLSSALTFNFDQQFNKFNARINFDHDVSLQIKNNVPDSMDKAINLGSSVERNILLKGTNYPINRNTEFDRILADNKIPRLAFSFVKHGIPENVLMLNMPFTRAKKIQEGNSMFADYLELFLNDIGDLKYLRAFCAVMMAITFKLEGDDLNDSINQFCQTASKELLSYLKKCSPIEDVRIAESFEIRKNNKEVSVSNLFFEFYQSGRWNSYSELSDGTKRILTLILSIVNLVDLNAILKSQEATPHQFVYFIEEPELGIHPDQLYKLMLILKEEARDKQIVITTHSPLVLDVLERDELDNIIVCSYDNEKGTQLRHLTEKQKEKALRYMDEVNYLSLYWLHSDLEKAPE